MPLPLAPIAGIALRYGTVALITYAAARRLEIQRGYHDQRAEEAMDDVNEGVSLHRSPDQLNGTGRFQRTVRLGENGPGIQLDITTLGRVRFRKV